LARVEDQLLREHVQHCVRHAMTSGNKAEQERKIEELMAVVSRAKA
jgi:DNA-binding FrmR family transcriptional regulator